MMSSQDETHNEFDAYLDPLLQHLAFVENHSLWIVIIPTVSFQGRAAEYLASRLKSTHKISEQKYSADSLSLAEKLRSLPYPEQSPAIVFLYDLDKLDSEKRKKAVMLLNRGREALAGTPYTVILFTLSETVSDIIHFAGDFWAWRSGVSDLSQIAADFADDREYADLRQRYIESLIAKFRHLEVHGLHRPMEINLESVYVPPTMLRPYQIRSHDSERLSASLKQPELDPRFYDLTEIHQNQDGNAATLMEVLRMYSNIVLLGEPGVGKTVLLQYLLLTFARGKQIVGDRLGLIEDPVPVMIPLRRFSDALANREADDLLGFLPNFLDYEGLKGFDQLVFDQLSKGRCVFLFDGLDEILNMPVRFQVAENLAAFAMRYPGNRYIVAGRLADHCSTPFERNFSQYIIPELSIGHIRKYIENWMEAVYQKFNTMNDVEELFSVIRENKRIGRLASNPLFLQLILLSYFTRRKISSKRIWLYKELTETLLERWDTQRDLRSQSLPSLDIIYEILDIIAYRMFESKPDETATFRELSMLCRQVLSSKHSPNDAEKKPDEILWYIIERTGLIIKVESDKYLFSNLPLQEYFVSRHITRHEDMTQAIMKHLHKPQWIEPIKLAIDIKSEHFLRESEKLINEIASAESPFESLLHRDLLLATQSLSIVARKAPRLALHLFDQLLNVFFKVDNEGRYLLLENRIADVLSESEVFYLFKRRLHDTLDDPDPLLRMKCVRALGKIGANDERAVSLLSACLKDKNAGVRSTAAMSLGKTGPEAVTPLLVLLRDEDDSVRLNAAISLGSIGNEEAIRGLLEALTDNSQSVRAIAATALGRAGGEKAAKGLEKVLLNDKSAGVRANAASSLGIIESPISQKALIKGTFDTDNFVRENVASALGNAGIHKAVGQLIQLLEDPAPNVVAAAATALGNMRDKLRNSNNDVRKNAAGAINFLVTDINSRRDIIEQIRENSSIKQEYLANAAAGLGLREEWIHRKLIEQLKSSSAWMKAEVAELLWRFGNTDENTIQSLIDTLDDESGIVRGVAVEALSWLAPNRSDVIEKLLVRIYDSDLDVKVTSIKAIERLKGKTARRIDVLMDEFKDSNSQIHSYIAEVLTSICLYDESVNAGQRLRVCELFAVFLSKPLPTPSINDPYNDIVYESFSRLVDYMTENEQIVKSALKTHEVKEGGILKLSSSPIDGEEYVLFGPNAVIAEWANKSPLAQKLCFKSGINIAEMFKSLSNQNPEEQAIETKSMVRKFWYTYPEFGPYPFLDTLSEIELHDNFISDYQDHLSNQLKVYLLGLCIYDQCKMIQQYVIDEVGNEEEFLRVWTLCALSLNVGYILENENALNPMDNSWLITKDAIEKTLSAPISVLNEFSHIRLLNSSEERRIANDLRLRSFELLGFNDLKIADGKDTLAMIAQYGRKAELGVSKSPFRRYYDYAISHDPDPPSRKRFRDHGIAGALLLVQNWKQFQKRVNALAEADHPFLNDEIKNNISNLNEKLQNTEETILHAASAIALHNISPSLWKKHTEGMFSNQLTLNRFRIKLDPSDNGQPVAFLMILSDIIQEWDRYPFRSIKGSESLFLSSHDFTIQLKNDRIFLAYRDDDIYRDPPKVKKSRFNKIKKELSSRLDADVVDRLIEWKDIKQSEFDTNGIEIPYSSITEDDSRIRVLISCAEEDEKKARRLYNDLKKLGLIPWLSSVDIKVGQSLEQALTQAMDKTDYVIALLSRYSLSSRGFVHKELKLALNRLDEYPSGKIFLIPVQLDDSEVHDYLLAKLKSVKLYESYKKGLKQIIRVVDPEKIEMIASFDASEISEDISESIQFKKAISEIEQLFIKAHYGQSYTKFYDLCKEHPHFSEKSASILRRHNEYQNRIISGLTPDESTAQIANAFQIILKKFKQEFQLA